MAPCPKPAPQNDGSMGVTGSWRRRRGGASLPKRDPLLLAFGQTSLPKVAGLGLDVTIGAERRRNNILLMAAYPPAPISPDALFPSV